MKKFNIKALLINHGEKIVFGFFALITLGVLAAGTTWARYPKSPDELKKSVSNAHDKIHSTENVWPKAKEQSFKVVDFSEKARQLFSTPSIARYDFSTPVFHPLYRKNEPKREPTYEPVIYLIANAGWVPLSVLSDEARKEAEEAAKEAGKEAEKDATTESDDEEFGHRNTGAASASPMGQTGYPGGSGGPGKGHSAGKPPGGRMPGGPPPGTGGGHGAGKPSSGKSPSGPTTGPGAGHSSGGKTGNSKAAGPGSGGGKLQMSLPMMMGGDNTMMGSGMMGGNSVTAGTSVRGVRFMAIRGLFPMKKQIENYKKALHIPDADAADLVEIFNFVLERQAAKAGTEPWKDAEWETVNLEAAIEVLRECSDLDPEDPVPNSLRDSVITMDLPLNLLGRWKSFATHPKIKDEELTREGIELEKRLFDALDDTLNDAKAIESAAPKRRGFSSVQRDVKGMVNTVRSSPDGRGMMDEMMKKMKEQQSASSTGVSGPGSMMGSMMSSMNGPGGMRGGMGMVDRLVTRKPYLLFRCFDFDVQPGMAYRYRVRLTLKNPNFGISPDELLGADTEIAKGEERDTPWSNISNPDVVRSTVNYFLKDVEREPYREDKVKSSSRPVALLSMYEWDTKLGAVVNDILDLRAIGEFIGEVKKGTLVPDLVAGTLEKGEHTFTTQDVLVDVESDANVPLDQHPDLKLTSEKGHTTKLGLLEGALVVTSHGELRAIGHPMDDRDKDDLKFWTKRSDDERKAIKEREKEATPAAGGNPGDMMSQMMMQRMGGGGGNQQGQRRTNPRRRQQRFADGDK